MTSSAVIVDTTYGPVSGNQRTSFMGDEFYSFRGIPYAKPPIGNLRFKDPIVPEPWIEPKDVTNQGYSSIFLETSGPNVGNISPYSSEDCLSINVYTKELNPKKKLPVMAWIHGGAFKTSSSSEFFHGPDYLMQKDVVLVSFNYRLGALGFLSIDNPSLGVPGNAGLKDQTLALRWIQNNIERFGGDSKNITLFGESAGGASVHLHMVSNLSKGLFHKAIAQSGTALCDWANYPRNDWTHRLAKKIGWNGEGGDIALYEFLKQADVNEIVKNQDKIRNMEEIMKGITTFGPSKEAYDSEGCFFVEEPSKLVQNAWSTNVPLIIGGVSDEGFLFYRALKSQLQYLTSVEGYQIVVPPSFGYAQGSKESLAVAQSVRDFYLPINATSDDITIETLKAWGDRWFWHSIHLSVKARLQDQKNNAPTFVYRFSVDSPIFNYKKLHLMGEYVPGTCHSDDVLYLFKNKYVTELAADSIELKTINRMVDMWTQFAATGNPNCDQVKPLTWEPVTNAAKPYDCLNIADDLRVIELPETKRIEFWESLFAIHEKSLFVTLI